MHDTLRVMSDLFPLIQGLTHGEATVGVSDRTTYLAYAPGKRMNFGIKPGDPVKEGSGAQLCIQSGKLTCREQPANLFGVPYLLFGAPARDAAGEVVGCLVVGLPLHLEAELNKMAEELASSMTQFNATFQEIAAVAENTAQSATTLAEATAQMNNSLKETQSVNTSITKVTDQTRLLGLNALIESAHAGAAGAGFGVVAREIQVLAQRSLKATQEMTQALATVSARNGAVMSETQSLQADSESLSAQVEECVAIVESLTAMAQKLKALAARKDEA